MGELKLCKSPAVKYQEVIFLLVAYKADCYAAEHRQVGQIFWQSVQVPVLQP